MSRLSEISFEPLEPYDGKLSCTVLRGERGSNAPDLPDITPNSVPRLANNNNRKNWFFVAISIIGTLSWFFLPLLLKDYYINR